MLYFSENVLLKLSRYNVVNCLSIDFKTVTEQNNWDCQQPLVSLLPLMCVKEINRDAL